MKSAARSFSIPVFLSLIFIAPLAFAGPRVVNCDKGDSLQQAVESGAGSAAPLEIKLLGTCYENISFSRDLVTIEGDGATTIVGQFRTFGSDQVYLTNLNITGPGAGLIAQNGRVRMTNVNIFGNEGGGIFARQGAAVHFRFGSLSDNMGNGVYAESSTVTLRNAEVARNQGDGILISLNSAVSIIDVNLHENESSGVAARMGSTIEISGSQVWGNHFMGAHVTGGSNGEVHDSQLNGNWVNGIDLTGNSTLDLHNVQLAWNGDHGGWVSEHSMLRLFSETRIEYNWNHGLGIHRDGGVVAADATAVADNFGYPQVVCHGVEASIDIDPEARVDSMDCPHPEY
jgi:hypothetical protein